GRVAVCDMFSLYFNGVYGEGITPYIQDLTGSGLDFTPNPENLSQIQTMPMWAVQGSAQVDIMPEKFWLSGGYSVARVAQKNGYYSASEYRRGTYIFGNVFYKVTDNLTLAAEYLHGGRKNMDGLKSSANRLSVMMQYNF
ncbi:MAG: porin, partial [Alistipes sp.]|nr:porin [Alistipes sp.]